MDKKLLGLVTLFFLSFLFFISIVLFNKPLTQLTRAKEDIQPSSENSLIFGWPLTAKANGKDEVNINVFVRSENNKLIPNKTVKLETNLGSIKILSDTSDKGGKTSFTLTSDSTGLAEISAVIDNSIPVAKKLTVKFE